MTDALITGITGQDGSYLAEFLIEKGYKIHGLVRRSSIMSRPRIEQLYFKNYNVNTKNIELHYGDLGDSSSLNRILKKCEPDEIYNLAAQSHVAISFNTPEYTGDVTGLGVVRLLDAVRDMGVKSKFYQASSSEMYGKVKNSPQTEDTPFNPQSPYACAKVFAYHITKMYREAYNMFACNGILFNHESPRRGINFVTRKITLSLARIKMGLQDKLSLGNLDAKRDWGYAKDYIEAMWMMLQHDKADDYVIAMGQNHSVREFAEKAAKILDFEIEWQGEGVKEKGVDSNTGKVIIEVVPKFYRPLDVHDLLGDPSKAKEILKWSPKVSFEELIEIMVKADLESVRREKDGMTEIY